MASLTVCDTDVIQDYIRFNNWTQRWLILKTVLRKLLELMMETFKTLVYSCNNVYTYPQNYVQRKCFTGKLLLLF